MTNTMATCNLKASHIRFSDNCGFTYIGLLIFIALLGAASAGTVTAGSTLARRSHEAELLFIGGQFRAAFQSYFESTPPGQTPYPKLLTDLLKDPRFPGIKRHLRRLYVDPLTGNEQWGLVRGPAGGIVGVYSLAGGATVKTQQFPAEFAFFEGKEKYSDWVFSYSVLTAPNVLSRQLAK